MDGVTVVSLGGVVAEAVADGGRFEGAGERGEDAVDGDANSRTASARVANPPRRRVRQCPSSGARSTQYVRFQSVHSRA
ncbi:hypothetical protein AMK19_18420 [Kitasatospora sp. CB01950]|nr:hypothetical protein AMK19_18420 [Kitasatospora sp. CB01950]